MDLHQRKLARHALGLPTTTGRAYRNRYFCTEGCPAHQQWEQMVAAGEAEKAPPDGRVDMFYLTYAAALAVCEAGETLDPEDFPNDRLD